MLAFYWLLPLLLHALLIYAGRNGCSVGNERSNSQPCLYIDSFEGIDSDCACVSVAFTNNTVGLQENLTVSSIMEFTLQSAGTHTSVQCSQDSGLTLIHVHSVTIINMSFKDCGISRSTLVGNYGPVNFHYALMISGCHSVFISNSRVANSRGTGLILMNNYNMSIAQSNFTENVLNTSDSRYIKETSYGGGGGIYLELSCSLPCSEPGICYCLNCTLHIEHCSFSGNHAAVKHSSANISDSGNSGLGNGGGLEVWINDSSFNNLYIGHSNFLDNSAIWGGAMQIIFSTRSQNNNVTMEYCMVDSNSVTDNGGGGLDLGYIRENVINNYILLKEVSFNRNRALFGGGIAIFTYNTSVQKGNHIYWEDCVWYGNSAHYGAAINVSPQRLYHGNNELMLEFKNCSFQSNLVFSKTIKEHIERNGKGIIMIAGGAMTFTKKVKFVNNNNSCIHAISSTVLFSQNTNAVFLNNTAFSGAGISLIGFSAIIVGNGTSLTFCNNSVTRFGAAIYYFSIDKNAHVHPRSCFIQKLDPNQKSENVLFNFFGNTKLQNPVYVDNRKKLDAIYGTSLETCSTDSENKEYMFYGIGKFRYCESCEYSMDNIENEYTVCERPSLPLVKSIEGNVTVQKGYNILKFIPGKKYVIPVSSGLYIVTIVNHGNSDVTIPESFAISHHKIILYGKPGDRATMTFTELFFRKLSVSIEVEALDCPPLYKIKGSRCVCISTEDVSFVEFHKCSHDMHQASLRRGYWINYIETDNKTKSESNVSDRYTLLSGYCPLGYCYNETNKDYRKLPENFSNMELNDAICNSRKEILCGLCENNKTVYFHSDFFRCDVTDFCHLGPLFYLLSEILPLTLLFLFIIFFNISFTSGYLNGFIFYAQMYDTIAKIGSSFISPSYQFSNLSIFHRLFFKLFNIDFFDIDTFAFCLFQTQKTLDILLIKYLTVGYGFFLVLGTVWLIQCCSKFRCLGMRKSRRYSVIQGLSAFLVMVYSQCTYISLSILNLIQIYAGAKPYKIVVFFQGNIGYFSVNHLPYAIPALLCILFFVAPLPLLLIVYPLCNKIIALLKLENNRAVKLTSRLLPVTKIKPLLDCFQGAFKDNYRFFAGLYFVYRVMILSSRLVTGVILIFTIIEVQLIIMLALHTFIWPYQKRIHNIIDLFVFTNLAIINGLKLLNFFYAENGAQAETNIRVTHAVQLLFIYIPIIVLFLAVIFKVGRNLKGFVVKSKKAIARRISNERSDEMEENRIPFENNDDAFLDNNRRSFASESYRMMRQNKADLLLD